jgi:VIT1/CCC1 family predicted Fe2+/Mn2+ transporter
MNLNSGEDNVETDSTKVNQAWYLNTSGSLRAAVLGVNDGLVSNFSLVMGVSGAIDNINLVFLSGIAGLLAGALSMAAGEYISMRSQKEVYEYQITLENLRIRTEPEEVEEDISSIYRAKGLSSTESKSVSHQIMSNMDVALDTISREKLGLNPSQLGSPWNAALSSFGAFACGASVPILPYFFIDKTFVVLASAILSSLALIIVGGSLARLTRNSIPWGGLRMLALGGVAATVTYAVGTIVGISISI